MGKSNKRKSTQKSNYSVSKGRTKKVKHQKGFKKQKVII